MKKKNKLQLQSRFFTQKDRIYLDARFVKVYLLFAISCQLRNCIMVLENQQNVPLNHISLDFLEVSMLDTDAHQRFGELKRDLEEALRNACDGDALRRKTSATYPLTKKKKIVNSHLGKPSSSYVIKLFPTYALSVEGGFKEVAYQISAMFAFDSDLETMSLFRKFEDQDGLFTKDVKWADFLTSLCTRIHERYEKVIDFGFPLTYQKTRLAFFLFTQTRCCVVLKQHKGEYVLSKWFAQLHPELARARRHQSFELKKEGLADAYLAYCSGGENAEADVEEYVRTPAYWNRKYMLKDAPQLGDALNESQAFQRNAHRHRHRIEQIFKARDWYLNTFLGLNNDGREDHVARERKQIARILTEHHPHPPSEGERRSCSAAIVDRLTSMIPEIFRYWCRRCDGYLNSETTKSSAQRGGGSEIYYEIDNRTNLGSGGKKDFDLLQCPLTNFLVFPQRATARNPRRQQHGGGAEASWHSGGGGGGRASTVRLVDTEEYGAFLDSFLEAMRVNLWKTPLQVASPPTHEQQMVKGLVQEATKLMRFRAYNRQLASGMLSGIFQMWHRRDVGSGPVPVPVVLNVLRRLQETYAGGYIGKEKDVERVELAYLGIPFASPPLNMYFPLDSVQRFKSRPPQDYASVNSCVRREMLYGKHGVQMAQAVDFVLASFLPYFQQHLPRDAVRPAGTMQLLSYGFQRGISGFLDSWKMQHKHTKRTLPFSTAHDQIVDAPTDPMISRALEDLAAQMKKKCAALGGATSLLDAFFTSSRKETELPPDALLAEEEAVVAPVSSLEIARCPWRLPCQLAAYAREDLVQGTMFPVRRKETRKRSQEKQSWRSNPVAYIQTSSVGQQGNCVMHREYAVLTKSVQKGDEIVFEK